MPWILTRLHLVEHAHRACQSRVWRRAPKRPSRPPPPARATWSTLAASAARIGCRGAMDAPRALGQVPLVDTHSVAAGGGSLDGRREDGQRCGDARRHALARPQRSTHLICRPSGRFTRGEDGICARWACGLALRWPSWQQPLSSRGARSAPSLHAQHSHLRWHHQPCAREPRLVQHTADVTMGARPSHRWWQGGALSSESAMRSQNGQTF